ncbi:hypothetical protein ABHF33_01055 [Chitinibacter sp. FCG-7]|uniref:Uncharacterized protein n=1 Tax=Chitinibacter mangrovi TaxID=3153927 RepID=A0AAU7FBI0_9NEIS
MSKIIERLTERLNALQTSSGIHLNRYLHFAIAEKTARPSLGQR